MITNSAGSIIRPGGFFNPTLDWERSIRVRFPSASTGTNFYTVWWLTDLLGHNQLELYAWLIGGVFSLSFYAKVASVVTDEIVTAPVASGSNVYATVRYTASTHTLELLVEGVVVDTATFSLAGQPTSFYTDALLDDGASLAGHSVGYDIFYQGHTSNAEVLAQRDSLTAIVTADLLSYCPLQTSIDLTAHNNTQTQYAADVGATVATDTTDPLLSTVAGPPTNTTANLATALTADSAVFQDTVSAGNSVPVWYKYSAVAGDTVIGICGFGDLINHYRPQVRVYAGLANALANTLYLNIVSLNVPAQLPVTPGTDYYFKFTAFGGAASPALLQVSLVKALNLPVPIGSIAVNDDVAGFPLAILDATTGYPIRFINDFPASEGAAVLSRGWVLTADEAAADLKLYDSDFETLLATIALTANDATKVATDGDSTFLIGLAKGASNAKLRLVSGAGVLNATVFDLGAANDLFAIGLSQDRTIGYFVKEGFNLPIKRWDLVNNVALADLAAGIGVLYEAGKDILVMTNGAIVVPYTSDTNDKILAYSAAGATLHTYDFGVFTGSHNGEDDRVFSAIDDPNSFWAWIRYDGGISRFFNIKYSDGSYLTQLVAMQFENGAYQGAATATPVRFGHSESCPAWIVRSAIIVLDPPDPNAPTWKLIGIDLAYQRLKGLRRSDP